MKFKKSGKKKKSQQSYLILLEVLQNGQPLAEYERSFRRFGSIRIGTTRGCHLELPLFPLPHPISIIEITTKGTFLQIDPSYEGFVSSKGEMVEISGEDRQFLTIPLTPGDFSSIFIGDLQVLIRIAGKQDIKKTDVVLDKSYRGSFFRTFIAGSKREVSALLVAGLAALICFSGLTLGLAKRKENRPRKVEQLNTKYVLPLINPAHLVNAPEALQVNLDRQNYPVSTIQYYESFTSLLMGWPIAHKDLLFDTSLELYKSVHKRNKKDVEEEIAKQEEAEDRLLSKPETALVSVPVVIGESLRGSLLRIFDKVDILHRSFELGLSERRKLHSDFSEDPAYDYTRYKNLSSSKNGENTLAQISPFKLLTNEEVMYKAAEDMAKYSQRRRSRVEANKYDKEYISPKNVEVIGVEAGIDFLSALSKTDLMALDEKIRDIRVSEFGTATKDRIREPLIGEIDPQLIEKTISRHRFELQLCYELALRKNQLTAGRMEWSWRIDSHGKTSEVELLSTTIRDRTLVRCVKGKIARWNFPRPRRGSIEVNYPFFFKPAKG